MKARFPIYSKVLFWFFVNLVVLATAGWLVLRGELRFSIFSEATVTTRVGQVVERMVKELSLQPGPQWSTITNAYGAKYGVDFYCFDAQGRLVAGPQGLVPPIVHSRMGPVNRRGPGNQRPDGPPPPRDGNFPPGRDAGPPGDEPPPPEFGREDGPPRRPGGRPEPVTRFAVESSDPHRYWVGIRVDTLMEGDRPGYVITRSTSPTGNGLYYDVRPFVWSGLAVLALSSLIWFPFVRGLTRSVKSMRDATERLAEGDFAARVDEPRRDELGELGDGINRMAVRLEGYVDGQKRFMSDVAHELCAPTARLQMSVGILEQRAPESERERLADVRDEVEHMSALVNELLQFSKASIGNKHVQLQPVDLLAMVQKAVHREAGSATNIELTIGENERVLAEPELLQRALGNLVRNAIRYAGTAGPIQISAEMRGGEIHITVADEGPGIPSAALPKIFDPFYRIDEARTSESGGVGLGLAIVKACVEACSGTVSASNRTPKGLAVTICLKRSAAETSERAFADASKTNA
jgi:two-component system, OmpR family, sensor histidine kinase CpxA